MRHSRRDVIASLGAAVFGLLGWRPRPAPSQVVGPVRPPDASPPARPARCQPSQAARASLNVISSGLVFSTYVGGGGSKG
jgi:hypothetical protein